MPALQQHHSPSVIAAHGGQYSRMDPQAEPTTSPVQDSHSDRPNLGVTRDRTMTTSLSMFSSSIQLADPAQPLLIANPTFEDRLEALKQYKVINGHINVSISDDKSLAQFCADIRYAKKNPESKVMKLTNEHIKALDHIGFVWESRRSNTKTFEDRLEALKQYKVINGHINVSISDDKSLAQFCVDLRYAKNNPDSKKGKNLTNKRIKALDDIGFVWESRRSRPKTFEDRLEALKQYKVINGHINVSISDDKSLAQFCADIRYAKKNPESKVMKLTNERIKALDDIGFVWNKNRTNYVRTNDDTLRHPEKLQALVDSKVVGVSVRIGNFQNTVDILLSETESTAIDSITNYARENDLKVGNYVSISGRFDAEDDDGKIFIGWNFEPMSDYPETNPCVGAIRDLVEKVLRKNFSYTDEAACKFFNEKIIWMERCPFIMPYDADRSTNKKKYNEILSKTDPPMERIGKRLVANLKIKSGIALGRRGYDFFIKKRVFHQHQIVQDEMMPHPERWVKGYLTEPQRSAILDVIVCVISRSLKIAVSPIPEDKMHLYLRVGQNNTEVARAKRKNNNEGNVMEKQKKSRNISLSATTIVNDDELDDEISLSATTILHAKDDESANYSFDVTAIEAVAV